MKRPMQILLITVAFDVYWTLVVMFRDQGVWLWLALAIIACLMLSATWRRYALSLAVIGCMLDTILVSSGLIAFSHEALLPLWMIALWLMFATVWTWLASNTTLSQGLLVLSATVGGPVAYCIGTYLGAITFLVPTWIVLSTMASGWFVMMLCFHKLVGRRLCAQQS